VALYLYGDKLNPAVATEKLGVNPTSSRYKGQVVVGRKTGREFAPAKIGVWVLDVDSKSLNLSDHIKILASKFGSGHIPFLEIEGVEEAEIDVFIAGDTDDECHGKVRFELNNEAIAALAHLSLPLRFTASFAKP